MDIYVCLAIFPFGKSDNKVLYIVICCILFFFNSNDLAHSGSSFRKKTVLFEC